MQMRQHVLAQLLHAPRDVDYVESFQALQTVNLEMRRSGPTAQRLLRKGLLEMEVGNYSAGLSAARDAAVLEPDNDEAHYMVGRAYVFLALAKADGIALGPSLRLTPGETTTSLVANAADAFRRVASLNPDDQEALRDVEVLEELMTNCPSETELLVALKRAGM